MQVGLGSRNPAKLAATERAFEAAGIQARVAPVAVDTGVREQPRSDAETVAGAENRARNALAAGEHDLGVGIEGGVAEVPGVQGRYLVMWAAATDGDRLGRGGGPRLRLPDPIAERVLSGEELGPVMDDVLGEERVAERQGAAGALTGRAMDRDDALACAVAGALGPFVTDRYG